MWARVLEFVVVYNQVSSTAVESGVDPGHYGINLVEKSDRSMTSSKCFQ